MLNYEGFFSIVVFLTNLVITVQRNDTQYNLHKRKINKFNHLLPNIKRKLAPWVYFLGRRFLNFSFQIIFETLILLRGIVSNSTKNNGNFPNRLSSTIDGNTECVHFQYSCLNVVSVNSNFLSDKTINKSDIFRLKCLSVSEISAILCVLYFCFYTFSFNVL